MMTTDMDQISGDRFATMRHAMVASQLRTTAVEDQRVVAAMARLPREDYLPRSARDLAYRDTAIALGGGRYANLPLATARLLDAADLHADERVLLIGSAGGYTAAVLAEIVAEVTAVESDPACVAIARERLEHAKRIVLVEGPLAEGHAAGAPYDVLVIDGAVPAVPQALADQIRPGGRAVLGLVDRGLTRLAAGARTPGGFAVMPFLDCDCAVLPGFDQPTPFRF